MHRVLALLSLAPSAALAMPTHRVQTHVGLTAGQASYTDVPFALEHGSVDAAAVLTPFSDGAFATSTYGGLEVGGAIVTQHVRVSLARRWNVPRFSMADTTDLAVGGISSTRRLQGDTWRLGLGYEIPTDADQPTAFLEVVGEYQSLHTDLALPSGAAHYHGTAFGYGLQGGAQIPFNEAAHITVAGEYGLYGQPTWSAMVGVGFHFGE